MTRLLALALLLAPLGARARPIEEIKKSGVLRIATEGAFPPFNYFEGKTLAGFEIDLGNEFAKHMGLKSEWKSLPFDSLLIGLDPSQDRYDMVIASHEISKEREKAVTFANPHYCTGTVIVAKPGGPKTLKELEGQLVAVGVGTTYMTFLQSKPQGVAVKEIKTYPKDTDALQNLMAGRVAAWVTDRFVALKAKSTVPDLQIGAPLFPARIAMAVSKGNSGLRKALDQALSSTMKDGTYAKLSQKYFQQDIRCVR